MAAVLLTELVGLFLHERGKGVEVAGNRFPGLFLGLDQRLVQRFDLLPLGGRVGAMHRERSLLLSARGGDTVAPDSVHGMRWFMLLGRADTLHRKNCVLRAAITFLTDARFLAPQVAIHRVALRQFVVSVTLRKGYARAIAEFAEHG